MNYILNRALDVETLFSLICKEEDADSKHIYFFLFKLLRKSILQKPDGQNNVEESPLNIVEAHLGKPPFEEPSITKSLINFLFYKYGKSGDLELQHMYEACKLFLYCLNLWKFETPTMFVNKLNNDKVDSETKNNPTDIQDNIINKQKHIALYKLNHTRWMCYNYIPSFCNSLEKHETIMIFGLSFLKLIFSIINKELQEKFLIEKDKIPTEKRLLFWNYLPK